MLLHMVLINPTILMLKLTSCSNKVGSGGFLKMMVIHHVKILICNKWNLNIWNNIYMIIGQNLDVQCWFMICVYNIMDAQLIVI
jgi:hypothetical protein